MTCTTPECLECESGILSQLNYLKMIQKVCEDARQSRTSTCHSCIVLQEEVGDGNSDDVAAAYDDSVLA